MNIKMKDIILVAFIMFVGFPIVYFAIMFASGKTRFNNPNAHKKSFTEVVSSVATHEKKLDADSLTATNTVTFQALQKERSGIEEERRKLEEDRQRLEMYQQDVEKQKDEVKSERERIEGLVEKSDAFDKKKSIQMAKAYSAMRPAEAAQILSTLSDANAMRILQGITEDRIRAKILAALPPEKATSITQAMVEATKLKND